MKAHILAASLAMSLSAAAIGPALADARTDCFSQDNSRRISGCSELIESPETSQNERSQALAMRALAYATMRQYRRSIPDYDKAIELNPGYAVAWNNRAWSLFKSGRFARAMPDVQRSLQLSPLSAHAYDTRAHIYQVTGKATKALSDYNMAIRLGGKYMTRLYQCGLQERGLYLGQLDGIDSPALQKGLKTCIGKAKCDPLPEDENCRQATS